MPWHGLHDGLWVPKELSNSLLRICEQTAARQTFPTLPVWSSLFRIQDISVPYELTEGQGTPGRSWEPLSASPLYLAHPTFLSLHPKPRLIRKRTGGGLAFFIAECVKEVAATLKYFRVGMLVMRPLTSCPWKFGGLSSGKARLQGSFQLPYFGILVCRLVGMAAKLRRRELSPGLPRDRRKY